MPGMGEVELRRVAQSGGRQIGGVKGRSRHYVMRPLGERGWKWNAGAILPPDGASDRAICSGK